ncbi:hypothetical protein WICPIJ_005830 [Wickerhamomyces pijperi]|uniref:Uncharacterized protein n=1 Tax=Wickerhamomyces pijperi TaxID=599730 RepID=A0A9P8Q507_WICPI|nr:hypothetical protein WICPIJ_005830 [Wickerhamomyces pijperi]
MSSCLLILAVPLNKPDINESSSLLFFSSDLYFSILLRPWIDFKSSRSSSLLRRFLLLLATGPDPVPVNKSSAPPWSSWKSVRVNKSLNSSFLNPPRFWFGSFKILSVKSILKI